MFSSHYRKLYLPQTHPDIPKYPDTPIQLSKESPEWLARLQSNSAEAATHSGNSIKGLAPFHPSCKLLTCRCSRNQANQGQRVFEAQKGLAGDTDKSAGAANGSDSVSHSFKDRIIISVRGRGTRQHRATCHLSSSAACASFSFCPTSHRTATSGTDLTTIVPYTGFLEGELFIFIQIRHEVDMLDVTVIR